MNLDLLKKLTKLANHNPNEHEANSAARRVCKMLEEANFSLINYASETQRKFYEQPKSSTPTRNAYSKDIFDDLFRYMNYGEKRNYGDWIPKPPPPKPKKEERVLTCNECGRVCKTSSYDGLTRNFMCGTCYQKFDKRRKDFFK